jgi:hypothetical protein
MKKYIRFGIGGIVTISMSIAIILTLVALNSDIPDDKVEDMAIEMGLVSMDEAEYPSIAEMEDRVVTWQAGEAFTDVTVKLSIFLCIVVIGAAVGLAGYKLIQDKKKLIKFSIPAGGLILIFIMSRLFATDSAEGINTAVTIDKSQLITVSTLMNVTITLLLVSFTALVLYRIKHQLTK